MGVILFISFGTSETVYDKLLKIILFLNGSLMHTKKEEEEEGEKMGEMRKRKKAITQNKAQSFPS